MSFNVDKLLNGLKNRFTEIQEQVNDLYQGENINNLTNLGSGLPLLGNDFANLVTQAGSPGQFIQNIYDQIAAKFQQVLGNADEATAAQIQTILFEVLGPNGAFGAEGILKDSNDPDSVITAEDIQVTVNAAGQLTVNLNLGQQITLAGVDLPQNMGLPGLGLAFSGNSELGVGLDYTFDLEFGLNASEAFFLGTDSEQELKLSLNPELPTASATMGFLQLNATDDGSGFDFTVDLAGGADGQLTNNEAIQTTVGGSAGLQFDLETSISGIAVLPKISTELNINWDFSQNSLAPTVGFDDTTVYFSEFLGDFLDPVLDRVNQITAPIKPIISALTKEIPFLGVSLIDIVAIGGQITPGAKDALKNLQTAFEVIEQLTALTELADQAAGFGINLGNLQLNNFDLYDPNLNQSPTFSPVQTNPNSPNSVYDSFLNLNTKESGLAFPILENPLSAVNLLLGQTVDFLKFDLPELGFVASINQDIPVFPPIVANFEGTIGAEVDLGFGFDSYGLELWAEAGFSASAIASIFDGFYVDDNRIEKDGQIIDLPEASLMGSIAASAGVSIGIAGVYVGGGVAATLFADLEDDGEDGDDLGNSDGKVRGSYIANLIDDGKLGCLFNFGGQIDAFLQAKLRLLFFTKRFEIARVTLARFELDPCPNDEPILANEGYEIDGVPTQNPELWLNIGLRASARKHFNTVDETEVFAITSKGETGDATITVTSFGFSQSYEGVNQIFASGGQKNDVIQTVLEVFNDAGEVIDTIDTIAVPIDFAGNGGDDWLQGGLANDRLQGNEGSDILEARGGNDTVEGGTGDDVLNGGDGDDWLSGGAGSDLLEGGQGNDQLHGDIGDEQGDDLLFGEAGQDQLFGHSGNDLLVGGSEDDTLSGGAGDDQLFGDSQEGDEVGNDFFVGEIGNDSISGGSGIDTVSYEASPNGVIANIDEQQAYANSDNLTPLEGQFAIASGTAQDGFGTTDSFAFTVVKQEFDDQGNVISETPVAISGSLENIIGSAHNDILIGNSQANQLEGRAGDDLLISTAGDDTLDGGENIDVVSYRRDPGPVYVNLAGQDYQNSGGYWHETIVSDRLIPTDTEPSFTLAAQTALDGFGNLDVVKNLEHIVGSGFNDMLIGNGINNIIEAWNGDDVLVGQAGDDQLSGGEGNDTASYRRDPAAVYVNLEEQRAIDGFDDEDQLKSIENAIGTLFADQLIGDAIANILIAGDSDDRVEARAGDDILFGEGGKDQLFGEAGDDFIVGGLAGDRIFGGTGSDTASYFTSATKVIANLTTGRGALGDARWDLYQSVENLEGSAYNDRLIGDANNNILSGLAENDFLDGREGDDYIDGGTGGDRLDGDAGNDKLHGQAGDDALDGDAGTDTLDGGAGQDVLWGGLDNDTLKGASGDDALDGDAGNDYLEGGDGQDVLQGRLGNDQLSGGDGQDNLDGDAGNDNLSGDAGDDDLDGGEGDDTLTGGLGEDFFYGSAGNDQINGNEEDDYLEGGQGQDTLNGGVGEDWLEAGFGADVLKGAGGADAMFGGKGSDTLAGGLGNDVMTGEGDRDTFIIQLGDGIDTITDFGGIGRGTTPSQAVLTEADLLKFEGVGFGAQNMMLIQNGNQLEITFEGIADTQIILENFALENLDNLPEAFNNPVMKGNILFNGQTTIQDDYHVFDADWQLAQILHQNSVTFLNDLDNTIQGLSNSNDVINGQGGNDNIQGLSGDDLLRGGDGNDTLAGGFGNDTLKGDRGIDTFILSAGKGSDTILDFDISADRLGLSNGLTVEQLLITQGINADANHTLITMQSTGEHLATLNNTLASTVNSSYFVSV